MATGASHPFDPRAWALWGKADSTQTIPGRPTWHPLLCHVLDVVACAEYLLREVRRDRWVALAKTLSLHPDAALPWLLFFVALHDLGKATPPFQANVHARRDALRCLGLDFPATDQPHGDLSVPLATAALATHGVPPSLGRWVARAVGAHHGAFVSLSTLLQLEADKGVLRTAYAGKHRLWSELRTALVDALARTCGLSSTHPRPAVPSHRADLHAFVADLAGLTTVTDWLGSNDEIFHYVEPPASPAAYLADARNRAAKAVEQAGWRRPPVSPVSPRRSFHALFNRSPWPLHRAVEAILPSLTGPSLLMVEAPMGEGKTEAALTVFEALAARGATGLYVALPTQATSNQIFHRVERFLRSAFPSEIHGLHLVHGDAGLSNRYDALKDKAFALRAVGGVAGAIDGPIADAWFARSKRALLAPVAVGTVDQALLGVLGVRHGFLRLHGLAGKVVVVDEVHAYDTYTSTLLLRLLEWLHALGASVVLLSATLPSSRRDALVRSFGASPPPPAKYPRLTLTGEGHASSRSFAPRRSARSLALTWQPPATLPRRLAEALQGGGCAVWIVNTVRRAQQTYRALWALRQGGLLPHGLSLGLLHARFPFEARASREDAAEQSFGPGEDHRPQAAILVGTQVLEQSLDLDFDLMVSDLAPVDLVLQRAGRLHRHDRTTPRPPAVAHPALWLVRPEDDQRPEGPTFRASTYVYAESILLRSWLALRDRTTLTLPTDIEPLIEQVYSGAGPLPPAALAARLATLDRDNQEASLAQNNRAHQVVLPPPDDDDPFRDLAKLDDSEDPSVHQALRAATRLGDPTVEVIPVLERDGMTVLASAPHVRVHLDAKAPLPRAVVVAIARQSIALRRPAVVHALLKQPVPPAFEVSAHLRYHRVLRLDRNASTVLAGVPLRLDPELGLVVGALDDDPLESSA